MVNLGLASGKIVLTLVALAPGKLNAASPLSGIISNSIRIILAIFSTYVVCRASIKRRGSTTEEKEGRNTELQTIIQGMRFRYQ